MGGADLDGNVRASLVLGGGDAVVPQRFGHRAVSVNGVGGGGGAAISTKSPM